jgi:hypothetical protein
MPCHDSWSHQCLSWWFRRACTQTCQSIGRQTAHMADPTPPPSRSWTAPHVLVSRVRPPRLMWICCRCCTAQKKAPPRRRPALTNGGSRAPSWTRRVLCVLHFRHPALRLPSLPQGPAACSEHAGLTLLDFAAASGGSIELAYTPPGAIATDGSPARCNNYIPSTTVLARYLWVVNVLARNNFVIVIGAWSWTHDAVGCQ